MKNNPALIGLAIFALSPSSHAATVTVGAGTYTENFNTLTPGETPAPGWDVRTGADASTLGTKNSLPTEVRAWSHNSGQFKNVSSVNIPQTSDSTAQLNNTDRALGLNQVTSFGNPGAAFNFNFSSTGVLLESITIDMLLLNNVGQSTTFSLQYGVGATPASFVTLATWSDASIPSGWGSTTLTFDRDDFGSSLDDQSQAWFRVVALTPTVGSGGARDQVAIDNFSINASAVPEPSAIAFGLLGALSLLGARRR